MGELEQLEKVDGFVSLEKKGRSSAIGRLLP